MEETEGGEGRGRRKGWEKRRVVYGSWVMRVVIRGMESHEQRWRELKRGEMVTIELVEGL